MRTVIPKTQVKNFQIPKMEIMGCGQLACPGCGASLALRYALKALGRKTVLVMPTCYSGIIGGPSTSSAIDVPVFHAACETTASAAMGVRISLASQGKTDFRVVAWAGDGGGGKIEFQSLSEAIERNENFIYVYLDNLIDSITKARNPKTKATKSLVETMVAHGIPYAATATVAYPQDFVSKFKKAKRIKGTRLLHLFAPCPPVLKIPTNLSIKLSRLAVQTRIFPLYEVESEGKYNLSTMPEMLPVKEFLKPQGRFRHLTQKQMAVLQRRVRDGWEHLIKRAEA